MGIWLVSTPLELNAWHSAGEDVLARERSVLMALYAAARGSEWRVDDNWGSGRPVGDWYGVTTDGAGVWLGLTCASTRCGA